MKKFTLIYGQGNPTLSLDIYKIIKEQLDFDILKIDYRTFPDGEPADRIIDWQKIKDQTIVIIQSANNIHLKEELLTLIYAAKQYTAKKIIVVVPFLIYRRQDKHTDKDYEINRSDMIIKQIKGMGGDEIIFCETHSKETLISCQQYDLLGFNVYAEQCFIDVLSPMIKNAHNKKQLCQVYSPDRGGLNRSIRFAKAAGFEYVLFSGKVRDNTGEVTIMNDPDILKDMIEEFDFNIKIINSDINIKDSIVIIIDDEASTCKTARLTGEYIKKLQPDKIIFCATHAVMSSGWKSYLIDDSPFDMIVIGNTILRNITNRTGGKITDSNMALPIAQAIIERVM